VPVRDDGRLVACLGFTWIAAAMPMQTAVAQYLPRVLATAEAISEELARRSKASRAAALPVDDDLG
jgi:DNA-binding IclR family transcriptional regulator